MDFAKICPTLKDISHGFLSLLAFLLTNQALKQINFWLILQIIWSNFDIWNLWNLTQILLLHENSVKLENFSFLQTVLNPTI